MAASWNGWPRVDQRPLFDGFGCTRRIDGVTRVTPDPARRHLPDAALTDAASGTDDPLSTARQPPDWRQLPA